ncbi:FkbM family methyltransferase [Nitrospirillum amazonense]|uniref:FkbM family methyltransferase n=1 Tax=Nitrospirillum amazonense TaxID=28077 RepID=UPI002DD45017|nr:FkbM family methyltransferase [Nitrospirillum amazonense]MEC4594317.1 FkbM family methyltransferase [Nitrospirillum amazonense]
MKFDLLGSFKRPLSAAAAQKMAQEIWDSGASIRTALVDNSANILGEVEARCGFMKYFIQDDPIGRSLEQYGEWAQQEVNLLSSLVGPGACCIDVGANIGYHSRSLAQAIGAGGRVMAFEANPLTAAVLRMNAQGVPGLEVYPFALAESVRKVRQRVVMRSLKKFNGGSFRIGAEVAPEGDAVIDREVDISLIALDGLSLDRLDLMKIDAEGMEAQILLGAVNTINRLSPYLYIECNTVNDFFQISPVLKKLSGYRWALCQFKPFSPGNFKRNEDVPFSYATETALVGCREDRWQELQSKLEAQTIPKVPADNLSAVAAGILAAPRYHDKSPIQRDPVKLVARLEDLERQLKAAQGALEAEQAASRRAREAGQAETALRKVYAERVDYLVTQTSVLAEQVAKASLLAAEKRLLMDRVAALEVERDTLRDAQALLTERHEMLQATCQELQTAAQDISVVQPLSDALADAERIAGIESDGSPADMTSLPLALDALTGRLQAMARAVSMAADARVARVAELERDLARDGAELNAVRVLLQDLSATIPGGEDIGDAAEGAGDLPDAVQGADFDSPLLKQILALASAARAARSTSVTSAADEVVHGTVVEQADQPQLMALEVMKAYGQLQEGRYQEQADQLTLLAEERDALRAELRQAREDLVRLTAINTNALQALTQFGDRHGMADVDMGEERGQELALPSPERVSLALVERLTHFMEWADRRSDERMGVPAIAAAKSYAVLQEGRYGELADQFSLMKDDRDHWRDHVEQLQATLTEVGGLASNSLDALIRFEEAVFASENTDTDQIPALVGDRGEGASVQRAMRALAGKVNTLLLQAHQLKKAEPENETLAMSLVASKSYALMQETRYSELLDELADIRERQEAGARQMNDLQYALVELLAINRLNVDAVARLADMLGVEASQADLGAAADASQGTAAALRNSIAALSAFIPSISLAVQQLQAKTEIDARMDFQRRSRERYALACQVFQTMDILTADSAFGG